MADVHYILLERSQRERAPKKNEKNSQAKIIKKFGQKFEWFI